MEFLILKQKIKGMANKGQATIEYILLITLVISIALGLGGPLGRHLKQFSGAMLGPEGYYACLTKEGLLPGETLSDGECGRYSQLALAEIQQIQSGQNFFQGSLTGNSLNNQNSAGANSESAKSRPRRTPSYKVSTNTNKDPGAKKNSSNLPGSGYNSTFSAPSDESFRAKRLKKRKKRYVVKKGKGKFTSKKSEYENTDSGFRISARNDTEEYFFILEREQRDTVFKLETQNQKPARGGAESESKTATLTTNTKLSESLQEDKETKMSFAGFIKFLVIAIVIVAAIMIIFSQIMEYQKQEA